MPLIIPKRSILAYPAGRAAGLNPKHIAAGGVRFSGIATPSNFVSLLTGQVGVITNTVTHRLDGAIGPSATFRDSQTDAITFSGMAQATTNNATVAAIFRFDATLSNAFKSFFWSGTWSLAVRTPIEFFNGNTETNSGIVPDADTPYFIIASANVNVTNFLLKNLVTGVTQTEFGDTSSTASGSEGNYVVGNFISSANNSFFGSIAAVMYAANYLSPFQMLQWAEDPWAFWYPSARLFRVAAAAAAAGIPNKIYQQNYAVKRASYY